MKLLGFSTDLPLWAVALVGLLSLGTCLLLALEVRRATEGGRFRRTGILGSGLLGLVLLVGTILRPERVQRSELGSGANVLLLVDGSLRLELPGGTGSSRRAAAMAAVERVQRRFARSRIREFEFADGELRGAGATRAPVESDLEAALRQGFELDGAPPDAVIVVSDGGFPAVSPTLTWSMPLHGIAVAEGVLNDVAVESASASSVAVAHEAFPLRVVVRRHGGVEELPTEVVASELLEGEPPKELARAKLDLSSGEAAVELSVLLERAGSRLLEVTLVGGGRDAVPENDRALVRVDVRRARLRILHVAGRPTYDARALRHFLKSDESIDLVAFFILRTIDDEVNATESELSLIPFPVEELFTEHLPSFDAIILQDIDANLYRLDRHFESIARYVRRGGGLILVGGPSGFASGGYAETPVSDVLPVAVPRMSEGADLREFEPRLTDAGADAPVLGALRKAMGEGSVSMSGTNLVGPAHPSALVLWEHPEVSAHGSPKTPLPVLSLREVGDGRTIALTVDGTHRLRFGEAASEHGGRAHSALWEGLLGWLMRDPRYERVRMRLEGECSPTHELTLVAEATQAEGKLLELVVTPVGSVSSSTTKLEQTVRNGQARFRIPKLDRGGYAARVRLGDAPPTRLVFPCEAYAGTFRDSRPRPEALRALVERSSGVFRRAEDAGDLPEPDVVARSVVEKSRPLLPPYVWSTASALGLALHFFLRRRGGLL